MRCTAYWIYLRLDQLASLALADLLAPQNWHCCHWRPVWWLEYAGIIKQKKGILGTLRLASLLSVGQYVLYLIYKHVLLGWFVVQWKDVQGSSGGETRLHHRNQGVLRNTCGLRSSRQMSVTSSTFYPLYVCHIVNLWVFLWTLVSILVTTWPMSSLHSGMFGLKRSKFLLNLRGMTWNTSEIRHNHESVNKKWIHPVWKVLSNLKMWSICTKIWAFFHCCWWFSKSTII